MRRSWSLVLLLCLLLLIISGLLASERARAVIALLSMALVIQCWFAQRRCVRSRSRLVLWTLLLALPAAGSLWLGLNVVRSYSYDGQSGSLLYSTVVRIQEIIVKAATVTGVAAMAWLLGETASLLGQMISQKIVGKKNTWWNKPLKGFWMLGHVIGYAIALLIASSFLRWTLLAVGLLGLAFAAVFRATRKDDEI
jgi:hypothetical protein